MNAMVTQTETQPPCTVALIHHSGAKSPPGHTLIHHSLCQCHTSPVGAGVNNAQRGAWGS